MPSRVVHIPVPDYLNGDFETVCEYVDGVLKQRNAGTRRHSITLRNLVLALKRAAIE